VAAGAAPDSGIAMLAVLLIFTVWPAQLLRITLRTWRKGQTLRTSVAYAFFIMIAFLPQIVGQIMYFADRLRNRSFRLVEYKSTASSSGKSRR
jgi:drug/metabolite transporter (DMT)-like permease